MATSPPPSPPRQKSPLVAVIGTTGVGKTDLGVELAQALTSRTSAPRSAEVINHDSMQCYRGLDIITNKATREELCGVPHHLMGFLDPGREWGVNDFLRDALDKIDKLEARETLPIAVGGTTYYLQNLVYPNQLVNDVPPSRPSTPEARPLATLAASERTPSPRRRASPEPPKTLADVASFPPSLRSSIETLPAELLALFLAFPALPPLSSPTALPFHFPLELLPPRLRSTQTLIPALYALLQHVDPDSARRWHWRDVRKVARAIEIVWTGRRWEDVRAEQRAKPVAGSRYRTLIFWLYADNESLHPRLDARIDKMVQRGLLDEIDELWRVAHAPGAEATDYSKGIYQAIGYKEFAPYLDYAHRSPNHTLESSPELRALFAEGVDKMKVATRQYAKRQIKWIKGKLLPAVRAAAAAAAEEDEGGPQDGEVTVVLLDASDLAKWSENVRAPAVDLLHRFLDGSPLPDPTTLSPAARTHLAPAVENADSSHSKRACPTCTRDPARPFLVEERQWAAHLASKVHRVALRKGDHRDRRGRERLVTKVEPPSAVGVNSELSESEHDGQSMSRPGQALLTPEP